jgi:hypothetical protein
VPCAHPATKVALKAPPMIFRILGFMDSLFVNFMLVLALAQKVTDYRA